MLAIYDNTISIKRPQYAYAMIKQCGFSLELCDRSREPEAASAIWAAAMAMGSKVTPLLLLLLRFEEGTDSLESGTSAVLDSIESYDLSSASSLHRMNIYRCQYGMGGVGGVLTSWLRANKHVDESCEAEMTPPILSRWARAMCRSAPQR